ncbi:MAG: TonB-dependent receptor [Terracidiphilus sp.]
MATSSTKLGIVLLLLFALAGALAEAQTDGVRICGTVLDPAGRPMAGARLEFDFASGALQKGATGSDGSFTIALPAWGVYAVRVEAAGFAPVTRQVQLSADAASLALRLERVAAAAEEVVVNGDVSEIALDAPDPSQMVLVREQLLDGNPGRPGAPISIPGLPIESASGGIKAPQYFAPGVMADHGEPIAQYISVGGYLVTNNLSANAHGNGYSDPNIYVSGALAGVTTDGGAFNVLKGNHALNLAATYMPRQQMKNFVTLTSDYRDLDMTAGFAPKNAAKKEWVALEANYGNGLLKDLEHRKMYKLNAQRVIDAGQHEITLFGIAYYGVSHEGNLVPIGYGQSLNDTLDPRQQDQTHTALVAVDDHWKLGSKDDVAFSGFARTYNLALFSNFGEGLIRQSEFRTVEGAQARETHNFTPWLQGMTGLDYHEDDIHNDDLDHYGPPYNNAQVYGPFTKVLSSNITIRDLTPYAAVHGDMGKHLRFYGGLRPDTIELKNDNKMVPADSFDIWSTFLAPKATLAWTPGTGRARWLPSASFSLGQAFFTQDPRISVQGTISGPTGAAALTSPFERSHSMQLVLEKTASNTDARLTVARTTTTETLGKIDPDNGTPFDLGPGKLKFLTASVRHQFNGYGSAQAVFSKADALVLNEFSSDPGWAVNSGWNPTVECPRTIFDGLVALDKLPLGLHGRGEYEYVGHRILDAANSQDGWKQLEAIPVGETRLALVRRFLDGRLEVGANGMLARGYTGQTTETIAPLASGGPWQVGDGIPSCAAGSGPSGAPNDFDCGSASGTEWPVGIRMVSSVGGSISWRLGVDK